MRGQIRVTGIYVLVLLLHLEAAITESLQTQTYYVPLYKL
jgi:hypothetical protein